MKNSIVGLSVMVTLLCGFLLIQKNREVAEARARAVAANEKRAELAVKLAKQGDRNENIRTEMRETRLEAAKEIAEAREMRSSPTKGNELSEIFRDEAMKSLLRTEAKVGVARNVKEMMSSGMAEHLKLNDAQKAAMSELLTTKSTLMWDRFLIPMMTGEVSEEQMPAVGNEIRKGLEENASQMRRTLGEEGYAAYQWYEKTQQDRENLKQFVPEFDREGQALSAEQQTQLLALMGEERMNFKFKNDISDPLQLNFDDWQGNFTNEKIDGHIQDMEQLNVQVMQRAKNVLTPGQAELLSNYLNRQLQQSKLTMKTTTATFAKKR